MVVEDQETFRVEALSRIMSSGECVLIMRYPNSDNFEIVSSNPPSRKLLQALDLARVYVEEKVSRFSTETLESVLDTLQMEK